MLTSGTGRTDFEELLEGDDELDFQTFTVIAVEAPGWGRSKPPIRKYSVNVYDNDCECFHAVMQVLEEILSYLSQSLQLIARTWVTTNTLLSVIRTAPELLS